MQIALETESDVLLTYLLLGDINHWMLHQANLRAYDGTNTLIGDVIGRTLEKYNELFNLPVLSPTMDETGQRMVDRSEYNDAEVKASVAPGKYITLTAQKAARVPVTGLRTEEAELYGGQYISYVTLSAGESVTLPLE